MASRSRAKSKKATSPRRRSASSTGRELVVWAPTQTDLAKALGVVYSPSSSRATSRSRSPLRSTYTRTVGGGGGDGGDLERSISSAMTQLSISEGASRATSRGSSVDRGQSFPSFRSFASALPSFRGEFAQIPSSVIVIDPSATAESNPLKAYAPMTVVPINTSKVRNAERAVADRIPRFYRFFINTEAMNLLDIGSLNRMWLDFEKVCPQKEDPLQDFITIQREGRFELGRWTLTTDPNTVWSPVAVMTHMKSPEIWITRIFYAELYEQLKFIVKENNPSAAEARIEFRDVQSIPHFIAAVTRVQSNWEWIHRGIFGDPFYVDPEDGRSAPLANKMLYPDIIFPGRFPVITSTTKRKVTGVHERILSDYIARMLWLLRRFSLITALFPMVRQQVFASPTSTMESAWQERALINYNAVVAEMRRVYSNTARELASAPTTATTATTTTTTTTTVTETKGTGPSLDVLTFPALQFSKGGLTWRINPSDIHICGQVLALLHKLIIPFDNWFNNELETVVGDLNIDFVVLSP